MVSIKGDGLGEGCVLIAQLGGSWGGLKGGRVWSGFFLLVGGCWVGRVVGWGTGGRGGDAPDKGRE
jgi:hypothetical protein